MKKRFNDYKSHVVTRGETTQSICSRYGIHESDLVQANPSIPLAKYGNGFFGPSTYKLDIKAGDHLKIPFYNEEKDKSGVKSIKGKNAVKVGVWENYEVAEWYAGTPPADRNPSKVKWNLYYLKNGAAPEKMLEKEEGKIRFQEKAVGNKYKVVGYLHEPELNNASALVVNVSAAEKKEIVSIKISDSNNKPIKGDLSYGQIINVHVETTGMKGEYIYLSLWEDDAKGPNHSETNKKNLVAEGKVLVGNKGVAHKQFVLKPDFAKIANAYLSKGDSDEGPVHEYYVTAYVTGETKASANINVRNPDFQEKRLTETQEHLEGSPSETKPENKTKPEEKQENKSQTESQIASTPITVNTSAVKIEVAESTTVAKVADSKPVITGVEALVDAYFAKAVFKKETSEAAGQHKYTFQKNNKDINKDEIAAIIKKRVDDKVRSEKKYAKLDDIKNALTKTSYKKDDSITINLYKLGPEYIKINNAPLEEEVFVVAKTVHLDGKEVTIKIKEKEEILVAKDADLKVLEAKENGNEITELKAKAENGIAKVKIKLRPKSDEDLKKWKEKLKGIKDGTHTYTFGGDGNKTKTDEEKKKIAGIILKKVNESLSSQKKFAKTEDIQKALVNEVYNKGQQITFDVYKEVTEYLWLKAECTGDTKKHEGEYLKREGAYFNLGKGKEIIFPLLVKPENDKENKWGKGYYWAASQGANQATFNSNRGGGTRKHAGRDLYTVPETPVVAICGGEVLEVKEFYAQTNQITVLHETNDGRKFIIRYGELKPNSITVKKGDKVTQKQQLGLTGHLVGITVITGETIYMLHFEHFTGEKGYDLTTPLSTDDLPFKRRTDLIDSITILEEGYINTFSENIVEELFTVEDGKKAINDLYNKYKDKKWNWKWEGSEKEVEVTGKDLVTIVEKMYRLETTHFTSKQYQNCGTGGMESFGSAPYYGWDSNLFTEQPIGTWSAFEGKGLSGQGGNAQVTTKQKEFVKLKSVLVGMEYKIKYIIKYEGNYARWYNATDTSAQEKYRESLKGIKARFVESL